MMVAAHKIDLKAAKAAGFKTAYIPRPMEIGPATRIDRSPEPFIDITAEGIVQLSSVLLGDRSHKAERHVDR
jgi:2-haloacid dehalogenase